METIVLIVLLAVGLIIAVDNLRQRRIRAIRTVDLRGLVTARLADPAAPVLATALERAIAAPATVEANVYSRLTESLEIADQRPRMRDGCEVKIFRLRWGNDYAMLARDDRELHYRLEVWEAELLPKMDGSRTVGRARGGADGGAAEASTQNPSPTWSSRCYSGGFLDPAPIPTDELIADRLDPSSPGSQEAEAIRQDPVDRLEGRRPPRPLLLPVRAASVLLVARRRGLGGGRDRRVDRVPGRRYREGLLDSGVRTRPPNPWSCSPSRSS